MFPRTGKTAKNGRYVPERVKCEHPDVNDIEIISAFHDKPSKGFDIDKIKSA